MKRSLSEKMENGRIRSGRYGSDASYGPAGAFMVVAPTSALLKIVSSGHDTEYGWEHVSVSIEHRTPNWQEMCWIKDQFWNEDECVVQYHPPKRDYINCHPNCLHLFRPINVALPMPPPELVGPKP